LTNIDGQSAQNSETAKMGRFSTPGRENLIRCEVRESMIRITCNDQTLVEWSGDQNRLKRYAPRLRSNRILYLGVHGRTVKFHRLTLTPLSGGYQLLVTVKRPSCYGARLRSGFFGRAMNEEGYAAGVELAGVG
jgi:hypothetical protein